MSTVQTMPSIFLCNNTGEYQTGTCTIRVSEPEIYGPCSLFHSYRHQLNGQIPDEIGIYKEKYSHWSHGKNDKFTLKLNGRHDGKGPLNVDVYFNKYDTGLERPLLFVIYFGKDLNEEFRYYKYSDFSGLFDGVSSKDLSELIDYKVGEGDKQLLQPLLIEDERRTDILTYSIERQSQGYYNNNGIFISGKEIIRANNGNSYGFYKHTHTPKESNKRSCVRYKDNVLLSWVEEGYGKYTELPNIQNLKYTRVTVYWSPKLSIPLMVECVKKNYHNDDEHSYYFQNQYKHRPYWQRLYKKTYEDFFGQVVKDENEIQSTLTKNVSKLLKLLEKIEFLLINTVIILLEKTTSYGEIDVEKLIKKENPEITLTSKITEAQPDPVNVVKKYCKNLEDSGYLCYRHSFRISESYKLGELRLLLPSENTNKYKELKLYSDVSSSVPDILYYENGQVDMFVYFYQNSTTRGSTGDPRPLLMIYDSKVYRPLDLNTYNIKWVRLNGVTAFSCDNFDDILITALSKVVGFLNIVNLDNLHDNPAETEPNTKSEFPDHSTYSVQKFNGLDINITISYENKNCYRVYTYTPGNTNGYRLGLVACGNGISKIQYPLNKQLKSVSTYYSVYDYYHEFPILAELKFSDTDKDYYVLKNTGTPNARWEKLKNHEVDENNIERSLSKIRSQMGITFMIKKDKKTLFDPKNCKENSNTPAVIGLLSGLALFVGGAGVFYYKYPEVFQPLYRRFH